MWKKLNKEQLAILDHTEHRAAGRLYCGDSSDMAALVKMGLMKSAGRKPFVEDEYFRITPKGRWIIKAAISPTRPTSPTLKPTTED